MKVYVKLVDVKQLFPVNKLTLSELYDLQNYVSRKVKAKLKNPLPRKKVKKNVR